MKNQIEQAWLHHWKKTLGNPTKKPRRVMNAYLNLLDISMDYLDDDMCLDCWPEEDIKDDAMDMASA
jgi:hypothetical protein